MIDILHTKFFFVFVAMGNARSKKRKEKKQ